MIILYKLVILISNKSNNKFTRIIETILVKKILAELEMLKFSSESDRIPIKYQVLVVDRFDVNSKHGTKIHLLFYVIRERLFRYLIFNLHPSCLKQANLIYTLSRIQLYILIIRHPFQILKSIFDHVAILPLTNNEIQHYRIVTIRSIYKRISFLNEEPLVDKFIFEPHWKIKLLNVGPNFKIRNYIVYKLTKWNLKHMRKFIFRNDLLIQYQYLLGLYFPFLKTFFQNNRILHINSLQNLDQILDDSSTPDRIQVLSDIEILNQFLIVKNNSLILYDQTCSPLYKNVAGQDGFFPTVELNTSKVILRNFGTIVRHIDSCLFLSFRTDENYFHFLFDLFPRFLTLNELPDEIPILIRNDMPLHFKKLIKKFSRKEIIELGLTDSLNVGSLYICPSISSVFDSDPGPRYQRVNFSAGPILKIRDLLTHNSKSSDQNFDFIYVVRPNSNTKNIINNKRIIKLLEQFKFKFIEADDSFYEHQIEIFSNAKIILCSGGALASNLIFIKPTAVVIILESYFSSKLKIWKKLSEITNANFEQIIGFPLSFRKKSNRIHSNYYISVRKLRKILERLMVSTT
jgi:hypothetical protein